MREVITACFLPRRGSVYDTADWQRPRKEQSCLERLWEMLPEKGSVTRVHAQRGGGGAKERQGSMWLLE